MLVFAPREIAEAIAHAETGAFALHVHRVIPCRVRAPRCFVRAVDAGQYIAHLFGRDAVDLIKVVQSLGVTRIKLERTGTAHQHIDLCGGPLFRALARCENPARVAELLAALPKPGAGASSGDPTLFS